MAKYKPDVFTKLSEIIRKAVEEAVEDKMQKHSMIEKNRKLKRGSGLSLNKNLDSSRNIPSKAQSYWIR